VLRSTRAIVVSAAKRFHDRFGLFPDIEAHRPDVRFTPQSRRRLSVLGCPLSAKSRHWQLNRLFRRREPKSPAGWIGRWSWHRLQTGKQPKPSARDGDLRPPVWLGNSRAPFSPLWLLLPCFRKIPASVLLAPTCRHNKFPTATAFADFLAASRRTNSQLGQIVYSCIIRWQSALQISNQTPGGARSGDL
jgi:hypothetical protein